MKTQCQLSHVITIALLASIMSLPMSATAEEVKYTGMCDASAAVALDANTFVVADDENNILKIYDRKATTTKPQKIELSKVFANEIQDGKKEEIDLEGATVLGDKIFWIGSHSTNSEAKQRPARHRLFAMQIKPDANGKFVATRSGNIYTTLLADLEKDQRFAPYKLDIAKKIAPKSIGGLSIEGLAVTPDGALLIAFRNPLAGGKIESTRLIGGHALIIKLRNPLAVIEGKPAEFADPIELDLGGYGIRDIAARNKDQYLIVAGPYHENKETPDHQREESRLYLWSDKLKPLKNKLGDFNAEAAFFYPQEEKTVQLLSDDGKSNCDNGFRSRIELIE